MTRPIGNKGLELIGIQLGKLPGLASTWLPLSQGLTVLYGLNGAGKSTILREVAHFLNPGAAYSPHTLYVRHPAMAQAVQAIERGDRQDWSNAMWESLERLPGLAGHVMSISEGSARAESFHLTDGLYEVLCGGYLCFQKTGGGISSYTVSVAAPVDDEIPVIRDRLRRFWAEVERRPTVWAVPDGTERAKLSQMLADAEAAGELELVSSLRTILFGEPDPHPMPTGEHFSDLFEPEDVPHLGNQEADGPYGGKRYLKLMDIAEVWASPIPTSFVDDLDPIEATATRFLARQSDVRTAVRVDEGATTTSLPRSLITEEDLGVAQVEANRLFSSLLLDNPELVLRQTSGLQSLIGPPFEWRARVDPGVWRGFARSDSVPLDVLSYAQQRWARFAISRSAAEGATGDSELLMIDEPEQGLHRAAERKLAEGLSRVTRDHGLTVIAATHSPDLLNRPDARVLGVTRMRGATRIREVTPPDRESMGELGLTPSDLLSRVRTFILVEGAHDRAVLAATIGEQLSLLNAHILMLGGATQLKGALQGQFLSDFTDARIVAVLDNLDLAYLRDSWRDAKSAKSRSGFGAGLAVLLERYSGRHLSTEQQFIREFLIRSMENDIEARVTVHGMSKPDIIMYLDVNKFVPNAESWECLWEESQRHQKGNLKAWLKQQYGVTIETVDVEEAARDLDDIHPDISGLVDVCT